MKRNMSKVFPFVFAMSSAGLATATCYTAFGPTPPACHICSLPPLPPGRCIIPGTEENEDVPYAALATSGQYFKIDLVKKCGGALGWIGSEGCGPLGFVIPYHGCNPQPIGSVPNGPECTDPS